MNERARKYSKILYFPDQRMQRLVTKTAEKPITKNPDMLRKPDRHYPFNCVSKYYPLANSLPKDVQIKFPLPCGFLYGESWGALKKCWRGYKIAKKANDRDLMMEYAKRIQTVEEQLGVPTASFPNLGLLGDIFFLYDKEKEMQLRQQYMAEKVVCDRYDVENVEQLVEEGKAVMFDNKKQMRIYQERERHQAAFKVFDMWAESPAQQEFFKANERRWQVREKVKDDLKRIKLELNAMTKQGVAVKNLKGEPKKKRAARRKFLLTQKILKESELASVMAVELVKTDTGWKYCKQILQDNLRQKLLYDHTPHYYLTDLKGHRLGNYKEEMDMGYDKDPYFYRLYLEQKEWEKIYSKESRISSRD